MRPGERMETRSRRSIRLVLAIQDLAIALVAMERVDDLDLPTIEL
jgi:hypothetical protein